MCNHARAKFDLQCNRLIETNLVHEPPVRNVNVTIIIIMRSQLQASNQRFKEQSHYNPSALSRFETSTLSLL